MTYADEIRTARLQAGYTCRALARKIGCHENSLYAWEAGRTRPSRTLARALNATLGLDLDIPDTPPPPPRHRWPLPPPPLPDQPRPGWRAEAACRGIDRELFYPSSPMQHPHPKVVAACNECPVRADCLADDLAYPEAERHGIRAGMHESTRRALTRQEENAA